MFTAGEFVILPSQKTFWTEDQRWNANPYYCEAHGSKRDLALSPTLSLLLRKFYLVVRLWQLPRDFGDVRVALVRACRQLLKRGNMREWTIKRPHVIRPTPILTKIATEVGIDPKPSHQVLFWQVITKKVHKMERKVDIWPILKKRVFQFFDPHVGCRKKLKWGFCWLKFF